MDGAVPGKGNCQPVPVNLFFWRISITYNIEAMLK